MAAFSYVLLPLSGLVAYTTGRDARVRFHGLQAIVFGTLWPALLFAASAASAGATQVLFAVGGVVWLALFVLTLAGRDPKLPGVGTYLQRVAEQPPGGG